MAYFTVVPYYFHFLYRIWQLSVFLKINLHISLTPSVEKKQKNYTAELISQLIYKPDINL